MPEWGLNVNKTPLNDFAEVLSTEDKAELSSRLRSLQEEKGIEGVVVTVALRFIGTGDHNDYDGGSGSSGGGGASGSW